MIDFIIDNRQYGATELGVAAWAHSKDRFLMQEAVDRFGLDTAIDVIEFLMTRKVIALDGEEYIFVGAAKKDKMFSGIEAEVERFRVFYRQEAGKAPGLAQVMKLLKKHKDWKEVVPRLYPSFEMETRARKQAWSSSKFFEVCANLETWLNQRRWEREFAVEEKEPVFDILSGEHARYMEAIAPIKNLPHYLTQPQFSAWETRTGPFTGIASRLSKTALDSIFKTAHENLQNSPALVARDGGLYSHLIKLTKQP